VTVADDFQEEGKEEMPFEEGILAQAEKKMDP
jgi:hypothetical protein